VIATVYFKNRVNKGWTKPEDAANQTQISEQEKAAVRARLVPVLATAQPNTRAQLVVALQKILHADFPKQWPDFVDLTMTLLNGSDMPSIFAGLQCLLAICRTYRF
jgi:D-aminopeptidase